ncbi:MAG: hypothetical protein R3D33_12230 [Hyphomicrobiaceae bacterium]
MGNLCWDMWKAGLALAVAALAVLVLGGHTAPAATPAAAAASAPVLADGTVPRCGSARILVNARVTGPGYALDGTIVLGPSLSRYPAVAQRIVVLHECAHLTVGRNEAAADCLAVATGRYQGWLTADGLDETCRAIAGTRADRTHSAGAGRCAQMRRCFAAAGATDASFTPLDATFESQSPSRSL